MKTFFLRHKTAFIVIGVVAVGIICLATIQMPIPTIGACEKGDTEQKDMCYMNAVNHDTSYKEATVCMNIQSEFMRRRCISYVGRNSNDTRVCDILHPSPQTTADWSDYLRCYRTIAENTRDVSLCENTQIFRSTEARDGCYENIGSRYKDVAVCEKISDSETRDDCFYFMMDDDLIQQDPSLCAKITARSPEKRNMCFYRIALRLADPSVCESIDREYRSGDMDGSWSPYESCLVEANLKTRTRWAF